MTLMLLEAMACGTPSVSFDVGGVSEAVRHNDSGYLARSADAADLARGITTLLDDEQFNEPWNRYQTRCNGLESFLHSETTQ